MKTRSIPTRRPRSVVTLLGLAIGALASTPVIAGDEPTGAARDITVLAVRHHMTEVGRSPAPPAEEVIELRHRVSYSDLDLTTTAGVAILNHRIRDAASAACRELQQLYPLAAGDAQCVTRAESDARGQATAAVSAMSPCATYSAAIR